METYQEGMLAIYICLTVLNLSVIGTAVYYVHRARQEGKIDRIKINVLIESMTEIFESKYKDDEEESGTKDIPRRN